MSDWAYGNDAEYWHGQYQKLYDALSVLGDAVGAAKTEAKQICNVSQPEKSCITCGWYCGKGQCAKKNHRACGDWISTD